MKCVGETKGITMNLKKILPYAALAVAFLGLGYLYGNCKNKESSQAEVQPRPNELPQMGKIEHSNEPDTLQCPPAPPAEACPPPPACPKPIVRTVPKWRDRPVYVERELAYGCTVNWRTGEVVARSKPGMNIECFVNKAAHKVDTYHYDPSLLRRGPNKGGVLEKAYNDYIEGRL